MSHVVNDLFFENVQRFCEEIGADPRHIIEDRKGKFVYVLEDTGEPIEGGVRQRKVYLPNDLQNHD